MPDQQVKRNECPFCTYQYHTRQQPITPRLALRVIQENVIRNALPQLVELESVCHIDGNSIQFEGFCLKEGKIAVPLNICFSASEIAPFAKTGGLADYAAGLSKFLGRKGHDVRVFMPLYDVIDTSHFYFHTVDFIQDVPLHLNDETINFTVRTAQLPYSNVHVYFIDCPRFYHRGQIYTQDADEWLRFAFFSRAVIESCQRMGWSPDIFHNNDWHTALIPLYAKTVYKWDGLFHRTRSVLTIHNHGYGYQGFHPMHCAWKTGLWAHLDWLPEEDREADIMNFLRTGILHSDAITPVSRTYADEIRTPELGDGLDELLRSKGDWVQGIVNGAEYTAWSPENDPYIPYHYARHNLKWKEENKKKLLEELHLPYDPEAPVLGFVSRLTEQKGIDLFNDCLYDVLYYNNVRLVVLGSGEYHYEQYFEWLQNQFPDKVRFWRGYNNELSHRIQAGSDMLMVPSRYEPCGLTQIYALKYGTVPIVRKTGGLADTVQHYDYELQTGTGFVFEHFSSVGLCWAVNFAIHTFPHKDVWTGLMQRGMMQNFSWDVQGEHYISLYYRLKHR